MGEIGAPTTGFLGLAPQSGTHNGTDWDARFQLETIQAGNGQTLLNTQVDQLIQAMAGFTQQTGLSWDAAAGGAGTAAQQAHFQGILAANWQ